MAYHGYDSEAAQIAYALPVPAERVVCIEHPCIVKDVDKGVKSLGGEHQVKNFLLPAGKSLSQHVSLRPGDTFSKRLMSRETPVNNLLCRVLLPKRTGRKRKRGSSDPFVFHDRPESSVDTHGTPNRPIDGEQMLQRLKDSPGVYRVEPVGLINETHRFRSLPDFQLGASDFPLMVDISKKLYNPSVSGIKAFRPRTETGPGEHPDIIGPPQFTQSGQLLNYMYLQNPAVVTELDEHGNKVTTNPQAPRKRDMYAVPADIDQVPRSAPSSLPPLATTNKYMRVAVANLAKLLQERPIATRRVAMNKIDWGSETLFKDATQYVGYSFRSGPWRDALVKYGVDPRTDPSYRIYQTLTFQLFTKDKMIELAKKQPDGTNHWIRGNRYKKDDGPASSHIFDGEGISTNGKTWQICDITDPLLHGILQTSDLPSKCDLDTWGWFHNGTLATARIIMRDKIHTMLQGQDPHSYDAVYEKLAQMPTRINAATLQGTYLSRPARTGEAEATKLADLAATIRQLAKVDQQLKVKEGRQRGPGAGKARPEPWHRLESAAASASKAGAGPGLSGAGGEDDDVDGGDGGSVDEVEGEGVHPTGLGGRDDASDGDDVGDDDEAGDGLEDEEEDEDNDGDGDDDDI